NTRSDMKAWTARIAVHNRPKPIQVDMITYNMITRVLKAYEVKRAFGDQDAEARRAIDKRLTALSSALPTHATFRSLSPAAINVAAVGYYGQLGRTIGPHRVLDALDFPSEFGAATAVFVTDVNKYFEHCLRRATVAHHFRALEQIASSALEQIAEM